MKIAVLGYPIWNKKNILDELSLELGNDTKAIVGDLSSKDSVIFSIRSRNFLWSYRYSVNNAGITNDNLLRMKDEDLDKA